MPDIKTDNQINLTNTQIPQLKTHLVAFSKMDTPQYRTMFDIYTFLSYYDRTNADIFIPTSYNKTTDKYLYKSINIDWADKTRALSLYKLQNIIYNLFNNQTSQ